MGEKLLLQFIALSIYVAFLGFIFCDFFKLPNIRKVIVFVFLTIIAAMVLRARNEFDLSLILPGPTLLALIMGIWQKKKLKKGEL